MAARMMFDGRDDSDSTFVVGARYTPDGKNRCAGTLIAPSLVLTSAHCLFAQVQARIYQFTPIQYVSIGSTNKNGTDDGEQIRVVKNVVHPDYKYNAFNWSTTYDFGLLVLEQPSEFNPIALDFSYFSSESDTTGNVYGYPNSTRQVESVHFLDQDACKNIYTQLNETNLCTQSATKNKCAYES
ncbi:hypothetical protein THRCLA_07811, partial [Thraustotheca clavata]